MLHLRCVHTWSVQQTEHVFEMSLKLFKAHHSNPNLFFIFGWSYEPGLNIKSRCYALYTVLKSSHRRVWFAERFMCVHTFKHAHFDN